MQLTKIDVLHWLWNNLDVCEELADAIHRDYVTIYPIPYSSADTYCAMVEWLTVAIAAEARLRHP